MFWRSRFFQDALQCHRATATISARPTPCAFQSHECSHRQTQVRIPKCRRSEFQVQYSSSFPFVVTVGDTRKEPGQITNFEENYSNSMAYKSILQIQLILYACRSSNDQDHRKPEDGQPDQPELPRKQRKRGEQGQNPGHNSNLCPGRARLKRGMNVRNIPPRPRPRDQGRGYQSAVPSKPEKHVFCHCDCPRLYSLEYDTTGAFFSASARVFPRWSPSRKERASTQEDVDARACHHR